MERWLNGGDELVSYYNSDETFYECSFSITVNRPAPSNEIYMTTMPVAECTYFYVYDPCLGKTTKRKDKNIY